MSRLFIHVYLDEDVDVRVADLLRGRGHSATTARDAGMLRRSDPQQLEYATRHEMAIVTHNRGDFEELARQYFTDCRSHCGIIISNKRPYPEIARRLLRILNDVTADEMDNQLRRI